MLYSTIKTLHIVAAIWLVAGITGRQISRFQARRTHDFDYFIKLISRSGWFERWMVIPGNMSVILLGLALGLMGGWPILGFLLGSSSNWLLVSNLLLVGGMLLVPFVYAPMGKRFDMELKQAKSEKRITPELHLAMDDSLVGRAHIAEFAGLFIVIVLMIFKPF
jgi:uncharacterized membrane protein